MLHEQCKRVPTTKLITSWAQAHFKGVMEDLVATNGQMECHKNNLPNASKLFISSQSVPDGHQLFLIAHFLQRF